MQFSLVAHRKVAAAATDTTPAKIDTTAARTNISTAAAIAVTKNVPETIAAMIIEAPRSHGTKWTPLHSTFIFPAFLCLSYIFI